ncbi:MAG: LamG-like jellyroll fold domain-containing protein [Bacteroidota bacterium]
MNNLFYRHRLTSTVSTLCLLFSLLFAVGVSAQSKLWQATTPNLEKQATDLMPQLPEIDDQRLFKLSVDKMIEVTALAKSEGATATTTTIDLPLPDGAFQTFKVWESSLMEKGLQEKYSEIRTYLIQGIDDRHASGRIMVSPYEFSAYFASFHAGREVFVRKVYKGQSNTYVSYLGKDAPVDEDWSCGYVEEETAHFGKRPQGENLQKTTTLTTGDQLRLFRLAITFPGATSEANNYTTKAEALAGIVSFLSEINAVYERDLSIRFVMPDNSDEIIFLDDATDPFTTNGGNLSLTENQVIQRQYIGLENYDLGFIFVLGGCCGAQGRVCTDARERSMNRFRDLRITCHEIGHQFSAAHTFYYCDGRSDGGNEVGSGTTIMSYIGICGPTNVPNPGGLNYFSARTRDQILDHIDQVVTCGTTLPTGNTAPSITVPTSGFYIPKKTPYILSGSGSDPNNSIVTYSWEQNDPAAPGIDPTIDPVASDGDVPIQRHFNPTTSPERIIPEFPLLLSNTSSNYERLPAYTRQLTYQLYARDNQPGAGGTIAKELNINVDGTAGPFVVTSQNTCSTVMAGNSQTITWNVANTNNTNVNVQQVNILLSVDGGYTWDYTLANNTANDGSESVMLPSNICTDQARIKVEAVGNIFFDINDQNFSIDDGSTIETPSALAFDGVDDGLIVNDNTVGNFGTGDFTIEAQVKTSFAGGYIASKREECNGDLSFWNIRITSNGFVNVELLEGTGGTNGSLTGSTNIADGNTHHIAVTRESGILKIWIDGQEDASRTLTSNLNSNAAITLASNVCEITFQGEITDFRIWNIARSNLEINDNKLCRLNGTETGLQLYYPLMITNCGGCGISGVLDATSNNYHATPQNETTIVPSTIDIEECPSCTNGNITINSQPSSTSVANEVNASFSVAATGNNVSYQWEVSMDGGVTFARIPEADASTYTFTASNSQNGNQYRCVLVNGCDIQTSTAATLTINCSSLNLSTITGETTPCQNNYYTYYVTPNVDVETWSWSAPSDWELTLFDNMVFVKVGSGSGNLSVTATDYCGTIDTETFAVNPVLVEITTQPSSQTITEGAAVNLTVGVSAGGGTTTYTWQQSVDDGLNYSNVSGVSAATYNIASATLDLDDSKYRCIIENGCLTDTSAVATLTVNCATSAPTITGSIIGTNTICGNAMLTYQIAPVPGATSYIWTLPSGWSGTSTTNSINVTANGTTGTLSVSAINSCGSSNTVSLEVAANPNTCQAAINFDGIDDYITTAQNGQYLNADMTVSFWVKPDRIEGFQTLIFNGTEFEILMDEGQLVYRHTRYGSSYDDAVDITFANISLSTNQWRHVSITRDVSEREIHLYIDGSLLETIQWGTAFPSTPRNNEDYPLTFGAGPNALITHFKGSLDEIKIWSEERTTTQILEDQYCQPVGTETNLLAYYSFDQGQPNGDNSAITTLTNAASAYPDATINELSKTGIASNIVDATKSSSISGNDFFCSAGEQLDFSIDLPGTPTVTWTLPSGWTGSSTSETVTATAGANGGLIIAEATLGCGTVRLEKIVTSITPETPSQFLGGNSLDFDGTDDGLTYPSGKIGIANSGFTAELWVKRGNSNSFQYLLSEGSSSTGLLIGFVSGSKVSIRDEGNELVTTASYTEQNWHHWAFVHDPSIASPNDNRFIYRDGILVASDRTENTINIDGTFRIANHFGGYFDGTLDEIRIWSVARSQAEIQANLYCPIDCINSDLELYLPFEDGIANADNTTLTTTTDYSTNASVATLSNFSLNGTASNFTSGLDISLYEDIDQDGFGGALWTCGSTANYVTNSDDCNDNDVNINPLASEICGNNMDDNCNGVTDENTLALNLDGNDDEVSFGNTLGNFGTGDFTLEARIKTTQKSGYILSKRDVCGFANFWNIRISNDGYVNMEMIEDVSGGNRGTLEGITDIADGVWHHITVSREAGILRIYVDGNFEASRTLTTNINNSAELKISGNACTNHFEGEIDEVRIWSIARTATEIDTYKNASLPVPQTGLDAYYDFNNDNATAAGTNTGQTIVTDRTGNHNGTMSNFALTGTTSNWVGNPTQTGCGGCTVSATLSNDSPVCTGETITFTALPSGETSYEFFNDANMNGQVDGGESLQSGSGETYSSSSLSDGDVISVLVNGCSVATSPVTINAIPNLVITDPAAVCAPNTVDLTSAAVTAGSDAGTLAYFTDAGLTNAVSTPSTVGAGTYYIELTANGCSTSAAVTVTVNATPNLVITDPAAVCSPNTVDLTAAAVTAGSDAGTLAYFTDIGLTNAVSTPSAVSAGIYYIELTANGCSASAAVNVTVNDIPDIASIGTQMNSCPDETVELTSLNIVDNNSVSGTTTTFHSAAPSSATDMSNQLASTTITADQTVFVMIANTTTGCFDVESFMVDIEACNVACGGVNNVLDFDGVNDRVELGSFSFYQDEFTIEGWMNSTDNSGGAFLFHVTNGTGTAIGIQRTGNSLGAFIRNPPSNSGGASIIGIDTPFDGNWHHFAMVKSSDNRIYLYIDGVLQGNSNPIGDFGTNVYDVILGYNAPTSPRYYDGQLDEIRLWNIARTGTEIQNNKDVELTGSETGLIAYYDFNQGVADGDNTGETSLTDRTTNANNGSFVNFALNNGATSNFTAPSPISGSASVTLTNDGTSCTGEDITFTASTGATNYEFFADTNSNDEVDAGESLQSSSANTYVTNTLSDGDVIKVLATFSANCKAVDFSVASVNTLSFASNVLSFSNASPQDYIVSSATGLPQGNAARTIECWVKTNQTTIGNIISWGSNSPGRRNSMAVRDGKLAYIGQGLDRKAVTTINDNTWRHIAITYDGSTMLFYVDGVLDDTWSVSNVNTDGQNLFIGKNVLNRNDEYYNGLLDEVRIWDNVRTAAQIQATKDVEFSGNEAGLLVYHNFNQGIPDGDNSAITTVTDGTANGFDGTLTNFALTGTTSNFTAPSPIGTGGGTLTLTNDGPACNGAALTLTATTGLASYDFFIDANMNGEIDNGESLQSGTSNVYTSSNLNDGDVITVLGTDSNGCTATATSTVVVSAIGMASNVLDFDGTNDYVDLGNFSFYQNSFTIEGWINSTDNSGGAMVFHVRQGNNSGISIQQSGNSLSFGVRNPPAASGGAFRVGTTNVFDGNWHHFAAVKGDDDRLYLYIDGVLEGSNSASIGDYGANIHEVVLGVNASTSPRYFDGQMDEIRLWNVARSASEIVAAKDTELSGSETGLVSYYNFNQGTAEGDNTGLTTLLDATTNANNGTLIDFALTGTTSNWMDGSIINSGVAFSNDGPVCAGNAITFTAAANGATNYEFFADADMDGEVDSGESLQNGASSTYMSSTLNNGDIISVLVSNAAGCTAVLTSTVSIAEDPFIINYSNDGPACAGQDILFTVNTSGAINYEFFIDTDMDGEVDAGESLQSNNANTFVANNLLDGDIISVLVTNAAGCTTVGTSTVSIESFDLTVLDNALHLDGSNDYVEVSSAISLPQGDEARTMEAWVKTTQTNIGNIISWGTRANRQRNGMAVRNGKLAFIGQFYDFKGKKTINDGEWHHVVITYDGTNWKLFVDGVEDQIDVNINGQPNTIGNDLRIGQVSKPSNGEFYNGLVDEVRIWNYARTSAQINASKDVALTGSEAGLLVYYNFDQGVPNGDNSTITTLTDATANNFDGALTNMTLIGTTSNFTTSRSEQPINNVGLANNGPICPGAAITFTATEGASNYEFFLDANENGVVDGGESLQNGTSNTYSSSGLNDGDIMSVLATDQDGCTAVLTSTVAISGFALQSGGNALDFDGGNDYVNVGNILTPSYTKEVWVNIDLNNRKNNNLISGSNTTGQHAFWVPQGTGYRVSAGHNGRWYDVRDPNPIATGWQHYAVTYDGPTMTMKLYRNGNLVSERTGVAAYVNGNGVLLGAYQNSNNFGGKMDEVRIWNYARTEAEIRAQKETALTGNEAGLIVYYDFNQNIPNGNNAGNTVLLDKSTNATNATLINFGLTAGDNSNWTISAAPIEVTDLSVVDNSPVCAGEEVTLTVSEGALDYTFFLDANMNGMVDNGESLQSGKDNSFTTSTLTSGDVVSILLTDTKGCTTVITSTPTIQSCGSTGFIVTFRTTSPNESIEIPTRGSGYNYTVDWGDGSSDSGQTGIASHVYAAAGLYTVSIEGDFPRIYFDGRSSSRRKIQSIKQWGDIEWTSFEYAFEGCTNLTYDATDVPDLSNVTSMRRMFYGCSAFNGAIGNWTMSTITDISSMFQNATRFNQDLSNWDVSNVERMRSILYEATAFNQSLGSWNITGLTSTSSLFYALSYCGMSTDNYDATLIGWAAQDVRSGIRLGANNLKYCTAKTERASLIRDKEWRFYGDEIDVVACNVGNTPFVTTWETSPEDNTITIYTDPNYQYNYTIDWGDGTVEENVTSSRSHTYTDGQPLHTVSITGLFPHFSAAGGYYRDRRRGSYTRFIFGDTGRNNAKQLKSIEQWGSQAWRSMVGTFAYTDGVIVNALDLPDMSQVINMSEFAYQARNFNADLSQWDVSKVRLMDEAFEYASTFNSDIGRWSVSNVQSMDDLFRRASAFNQDLGNWELNSLTTRSFTLYDSDGSRRFRIRPRSGDDMLDYSGLDVSTYDNTLIGWRLQNPDFSARIGASRLEYCNGEDARNYLINTAQWDISDDDKNEDCASSAFATEDISEIEITEPVIQLDEMQADIAVYPNPAESQVTIAVNPMDSPMRHLMVRDQLGRVVWSMDLGEGETQVDVSLQERSFSAGIYTVSLQLADQILTKQLVIVK